MSSSDDDTPEHRAGEASPSEGDPPSPRPLTIDDVPRLGSGSGIAIGCALVVVVATVAFWLVRGVFLAP